MQLRSKIQLRLYILTLVSTTQAIENFFRGSIRYKQRSDESGWFLPKVQHNAEMGLPIIFVLLLKDFRRGYVDVCFWGCQYVRYSFTAHKFRYILTPKRKSFPALESRNFCASDPFASMMECWEVDVKTTVKGYWINIEVKAVLPCEK